MAHPRRALLLLGTQAIALGILVLALSADAAAAGRPTAPLRVSVTVVRSCGVDHQSGRLDVRCTRGAADRVMVTADDPRVVTLERQGSEVGTVVDAGRGGGERFVTLQF